MSISIAKRQRAKKKVIAMYQTRSGRKRDGVTYRSIAAELGVSMASVYKWINIEDALPQAMACDRILG